MEKNEYRLIIDINDLTNASSGGGGPISNTTNSLNSTPGISNTNTSQQGNISGQKAFNTLKRLVKFEIARPYLSTTKQIIQNDVDTYFGSSELSQRIGMAMNVGTTIRQSAVQGMALSSVLGISTGAGILITGTLTLMQKSFEIMARQNEINNKQKLENEQLQILRGRAGIQFNRSRMGE